MTTCPFCGGQVTRVIASSAAGERAYSLCCDVGLDLIDNFEVFEALPADLRDLAIEQGRQARREMNEKDRHEAARFKASLARWHENFRHLSQKENETWL